MNVNNVTVKNGLTARCLLNELMPWLNDETFDQILLWPPNLFAFTSAIMSVTGAYHIAVSPPFVVHPEMPSKFKWPLDESRYQNLLIKGQELWNLSNNIDCNFKIKIVGQCYECIKIDSQTEKTLDDKCTQSCNFKYENKIINNVKNNNHYPTPQLKYSWMRCMQKIGRFWRFSLKNFNTNLISDDTVSMKRKVLNDYLQEWVPADVVYLWYSIKGWLLSGSDLAELQQNSELSAIINVMESILSLHAIADEACAGWGISTIDVIGKNSNAQKYAEEELLSKHGTLATIDRNRARVLPKRHTPNVGITLRSFSSHLGFHRSSVDVNWIVASENPISNHIKDEQSFSVLLLPWPLKVKAQDFRKVNVNSVNINHSEYDFFVYDPDRNKKRYNQEYDFDPSEFEEVLIEALKEVKSVDMVIFPEASINEKTARKLEQILASKEYNVSVFVFGVREEPQVSGDQNKHESLKNNVVYFNTLKPKNNTRVTNSYEYRKETKNSKSIFRQMKHHRWKITRSQVIQYGLGRVLKPHINWWEAINIQQRKVTFLNIGERITLCPLICEDLARQDPIADLIRTVGPSMVITILMDGPQRVDRWSSRYASVLADDPGSSVITLTSYGMVERWNHSAKEKSRIISLWNDGRGPAREIPLEKDAKAVLLSLCVEDKNEKVADGRIEMYKTSIVTLGGVHQIYLDQNKK